MIKEMREVCQLRRPNAKGKMVYADHWFDRLINRRLSIYLTWLFVKLNISANTVSLMVIILGLIGVPLLIPHVFWLNIAGGLFLMMAKLFDCVDGEVARWNKQSSLRGVYLDLVGHSLCNGIISSLCALHLYNLEKEPHYLSLAFLAYFISQSGYTLKEEFRIIRLQIPSSEKSMKLKEGHKSNGLFQLIRRILRWFVVNLVTRMSVDHILIRILTISAILISYLGSNTPMIVLSYWFVVAGSIGLVKEIASKYFVHIPNTSHIKTV